MNKITTLIIVFLVFLLVILKLTTIQQVEPEKKSCALLKCKPLSIEELEVSEENKTDFLIKI